MGNWKVPADLRYTKNDEWLRIEGDTGTIGISDFAQDQLNDIVYVELPDVDTELGKGDSFGVVESVKAASDIFAPIAGTITAVNDALMEQPELLNTDPYGAGWLIKIKVADASQAADLMDAGAYAEYCEGR